MYKIFIWVEVDILQKETKMGQLKFKEASFIVVGQNVISQQEAEQEHRDRNIGQEEQGGSSDLVVYKQKLL